MQPNKILKGLALTASIMVIAACSSSQQSATDGSGDGLLGPGSGMDVIHGDLSAEQMARLQLHQLAQSNTVYFGLDKYDISPQFADALNQHADFLRSHPSYKVTIEGHTDERGTPEYNIALGERRANAVKMYLQGRGVPADQLSIISYGKEKPAVLGHDEAAWSKNRRAIIDY